MFFETWAIFQELVRVFIKELDTKNKRISATIDTSSVTKEKMFSQGLLLLVVRAIPVLVLDQCGLSHHFHLVTKKTEDFLFVLDRSRNCLPNGFVQKIPVVHH